MTKINFILLFACIALLFQAPLGAEIRMTMAEATEAAIEKPKPEYNPIARQMKVAGEVVVDAHVNEQGTVVEVKVVSGNAMLTSNVVKAVKTWKFKPMPSPAVATLKFSFKLS